MTGKTKLSGFRKAVIAPLLTGALALSPYAASTAYAQDAKADNRQNGVHYVARGGLNFYGSGNKCKISEIPEQIRNIPIHPDDTYVNKRNEGPIPSGIECPKTYISAKGFLGIGYHTKSYRAEAGGTAAYNMLYSHNLRERNYTNDVGHETRGTGAALTYYGFVSRFPDRSDFIPGFFVQFSKEFGRESDGAVGSGFLKYEIDFSRIDLETGWDRYNSLEALKTFHIFDVTNHKIGYGMELRGDSANSTIFTVFAGYAISQARPAGLGESMNLSPCGGFFVDINIMFGR